MSEMDYKPVAHDHEAFLHKALKRKKFREAYEGLAEEYALAREMLAARSRSGLTQEAVAGLLNRCISPQQAADRLLQGELR